MKAGLKGAIKRKIQYDFRGKLISDNLEEEMKFIRFLASPFMIAIVILLLDLLIISIFNVIVNIFTDTPMDMILSKIETLNPGFKKDLFDKLREFTFSFSLFKFAFSYCSDFFRILYYVLFGILLFIDIKLAYTIRASYSRKYVNKGTQGTARWTTLNELDKQYKKVDLYPTREENSEIKTNFYKGKTGTIVSRYRDKLYLDTNITNNLYLGTTQSGKDECFVYSSIDIYSRAEDIAERPSMIVFDPKMEAYKSMKKELEKRGYYVPLLNLDDPKHSMGYDPLVFATKLYKEGEIDRASQLVRSFSFGIFNNDDSNSEPIWQNTSTDLFTSLILAYMSDCLEIDENINKYRKYVFLKAQKNFEAIESDKEKKAKREEYDLWAKNNLDESGEEIDYKYDDLPRYVPTDIEYKELVKYEKSITPYSVITFFQNLLNTEIKKDDKGAKDQQARERIANNMLDDYFNKRPINDYARSLYLSIKFAGARTKGSIFVNMQSAISIFLLPAIANLTSETSINFSELGFGDKPMAIFISIPTDNKSNHFIASIFISQTFQYLSHLARSRKGKLDRRVIYILNEFGNMPQIPDFNHYVTNCVGMGITFNIFIHAYNQIDAEYQKHADTLKENFPNQFYIMSIGHNSAEFFSKNLRNKTVISAERTGELFGLKKSFMERITERPLLYSDELNKFRMGECALYRGIHRTDNLGNAVKPYPIINEYQDNIRLRLPILFLKILFKRLFKRKYMYVLDQEDGLLRELKVVTKVDLANSEVRKTTFFEELSISINNKKRYLGTAMLFRFEYAEKTFPSPKTIEFKDICNELIQDKYRNLVVDIEKILKLRNGE